jgi:hypothetical protein
MEGWLFCSKIDLIGTRRFIAITQRVATHIGDSSTVPISDMTEPIMRGVARTLRSRSMAANAPTASLRAARFWRE